MSTENSRALAVLALALFWRGCHALPRCRAGTRRQSPADAATAPPQQPAAAADQRADNPRPIELVVVPVTVKDSRGNWSATSAQDEFRVLEDGVEQRISLFSAETVPLSAVVLVDDGLKTKTAEQVQKSLVAMAGGFSASDEVAVGRFDAFYTPVLDFTRTTTS